MIAIDSINHTCAANIYFDILDIQVDVSVAAMATENASGPTAIDVDFGVLHVHVQVALAALKPNDAAAPRPILISGNVAINGNIADDEIVIAAELLVCIMTVTTVAMDSMRSGPFALDREGAARDFRVQCTRLPVMDNRNPSPVRGHVGGREE